MSAGLELLDSILKSGDKGQTLLTTLPSVLFKGPESDVLAFIRGHVAKTGVFPQHTTISAETGVEMPDSVEPPEYYVDKLRTRHTHQGVKHLLLEAEQQLKAKNPQGALASLLQKAVALNVEQHTGKVYEFGSTGAELVLQEYLKKQQGGHDLGIQLGWPSFDAMNAGLQPGDVVVIVGRPASGKTYLTLWGARHAWWTQKKSILYVGMEMKPLPLLQRVAAIQTHVSITDLKKGEMATPVWDKFKGDLMGLSSHDAKFWVVDGNLTANVADIVGYARQMKVDMVVVDGAYMLQASHPKMARWEKVTETVEGLKSRVAQDLGIPVVASYQLNRASTKKGSGEEGLEDIGYSDAIGQIASIVLGLFQPDTVETLRERQIRILKGREGEMGEFLVRWVFDHYGTAVDKDGKPLSSWTQPMDFSEVTAADQKKLVV